jgi:hypothetical protein
VAKTQQSMAAAALRQVFIQPDRAQASQTLRHVADQLQQKWPKLAAFIDDSESDVLSHLDFPEQHRSKLHSTNPLERLNNEVKRRADVVCIFPNEASIIRLIGAMLLEQNDEWQLQHRYMQVEAMAELFLPTNEAETRVARRIAPVRGPQIGTMLGRAGAVLLILAITSIMVDVPYSVLATHPRPRRGCHHYSGPMRWSFGGGPTTGGASLVGNRRRDAERWALALLIATINRTPPAVEVIILSYGITAILIVTAYIMWWTEFMRSLDVRQTR